MQRSSAVLFSRSPAAVTQGDAISLNMTTPRMEWSGHLAIFELLLILWTGWGGLRQGGQFLNPALVRADEQFLTIRNPQFVEDVSEVMPDRNA